MRNGFRILLIMIAVLIAAGIGIISPDSAFSKMIHANVSNHTAMEPVIAVFYEVHSGKVQGTILSISSSSISIFNSATRSDENYILNSKTKLENKNLSEIGLSPAGENRMTEQENLPNLLRKGYMVILDIFPNSNIVKSIKIMERPQ